MLENIYHFVVINTICFTYEKNNKILVAQIPQIHKSLTEILQNYKDIFVKIS